jgi:hypothetical protein
MLSFHHLDNEEKTDILNSKHHISEKIKEVDKCILVCENCHREIHAEMKFNERQQLNKKLCLLYKNEHPHCKNCNYEKCNSALEFHHKNTEEKDFGITKKSQLHSWKTIEDMHDYIKNELDKCDIYCANCHGEIHTDLKRYEQYKNEIIEKSKIVNTIKRNKVDSYKVLELWDSGIKDQFEIAKLLKCSRCRVWEILKSNARTGK